MYDSVKEYLLKVITEAVRQLSNPFFYSSHILPHMSFSSTVWDGCGETHLNKLNSHHRRVAKLLLPGKTSSTNETLKARSILPLQKQLDFNKAVLMLKVTKRLILTYIISVFRESNNRSDRYVLH